MTDTALFDAVLPWFIAAVGVFGLLIGSFLNVVIWRVPRGESLLPGSRCPRCDEPIRPWHNVPVISWLALRGRCAHCRARIRVRYPLVELGTGVAYALLGWWYASNFGLPGIGAGGAGDAPLATIAWWLALAAYLWFAAAGIALTLIDLELQRLPDAIVLPSLAVVGVLLALAHALNGDWWGVVSVIGGAAALFAFYLVIVLVYPAGMGGGDVKLAPVIGAALGFIGWGAVLVGAFAGFVIGALIGLTTMAVKRVGRKHAIPFGPSMLIGGWIGIVWGEQLLGAYLRLVGLA